MKIIKGRHIATPPGGEPDLIKVDYGLWGMPLEIGVITTEVLPACFYDPLELAEDIYHELAAYDVRLITRCVGFASEWHKRAAIKQAMKDPVRFARSSFYKIDYPTYWKTAWYQNTKFRQIANQGWKCGRCESRSLLKFQLHHIRPQVRRGTERMGVDVVALCRSCHEIEHRPTGRPSPAVNSPIPHYTQPLLI